MTHEYYEECVILYKNILSDTKELDRTLNNLVLERHMLINNTCTKCELEEIDYHIDFIKLYILLNNENLKQSLHN